MRSLLFVPADSAKKLDKAMASGADADSCARKENPCARRLRASWTSRSNIDAQPDVRCENSKGHAFQSVTDSKEAEYHQLLALPVAGALLQSEIEQAFKIAATRAHPDVGGSGEEFKQLAAAKDVLIERWQR